MSSIKKIRATGRGSVRSGPGPLRNLIERLGLLESKVQSLESELRLVKRKLGNYESMSMPTGATARMNSSSINEAVSRQLKEQQFAIVPITDDIRITRVSGSSGAGGPSTSFGPNRSRNRSPVSPGHGHGPVFVKTEYQGQGQEPDFLDVDIDWGFQGHGQGQDFEMEGDSDSLDTQGHHSRSSATAKDPDWTVSKTSGRRKRPGAPIEWDTSGIEPEFIKSPMGLPMLVLQGYVYRRRKLCGQTEYWTCVKFPKCRANRTTISVTADDEQHQQQQIRRLTAGSATHTHPPDEAEIAKRKRLQLLKEAAKNSVDKASQIIANSGLAEVIPGDFPELKNLRNIINYTRKPKKSRRSKSDQETTIVPELPAPENLDDDDLPQILEENL